MKIMAVPQKRELTFSLVLVPSDRQDAPIFKLNNGVLLYNQGQTKNWKTYDLYVISDRPLDECQLVLSPDLHVCKLKETTNPHSMAIEATTNRVFGHGLREEFIKKYIETSNANKQMRFTIPQVKKGICCSPMLGLNSHGSYCFTCDGMKEGYFGDSDADGFIITKSI